MSESAHQQAVVRWHLLAQKKWPELDMLYAVPNGGYRNKATAGRMKGEGVKPGVPDLVLAVARQGYCGLYIEMKSPAEPGKRKGVVSDDQKRWHRRLREEGYRVEVCYGFDEARAVLEDYLGNECIQG